MEIIKFLFGAFYWIYLLEVCPTDHSNDGVARPRLYVLMLNKSKGRILYDPCTMYNLIKAELQQSIPTSARDYMVATPRDVEVAAMQLAAQRHTAYLPASSSALLTKADLIIS